MAAIELRGVHWGYPGGRETVTVLDQVDLRVDEGEIVALLGQSGSGKSSLLNLISGIEPVQGGDIIIGGQSIHGLDEEQRTRFRRHHIGFVYQFFNLIPTLTAAENIGLVLELNNSPKTQIRTAVQTLLGQLGMAGRTDAFPDVLSGGEQQRIAIGRALVHQPRLLLADEPTGNLDAQSGQQVLQLLIRQARERHASLLLVTHNSQVASQADRVVGLVDGVLVDNPDALTW